MGRFPEKISLVCGDRIEHVDKLVAHSFRVEQIIAVIGNESMPKAVNRLRSLPSNMIFLTGGSLMPQKS